eukprot:6862636-Alexandrium_andersonii.AAC.1
MEHPCKHALLSGPGCCTTELSTCTFARALLSGACAPARTFFEPWPGAHAVARGSDFRARD